MARIHEYQAKEILGKLGIAVPRGRCVASAEEARDVAYDIGKPVVIKAQVWVTGRLKAGGIKFASTPEEAEKVARELIGGDIKGLTVEKVLVEEQLEVDRELYVGVIVSNSYQVKGPILILSTEGGSSIEEVSQRNPERIARLNVDYLQGVGLGEANQLLSNVSFNGSSLSHELTNELAKV
ncbi:unnamed protein product, partial [marine sediment metagenome]